MVDSGREPRCEIEDASVGPDHRSAFVLLDGAPDDERRIVGRRAGSLLELEGTRLDVGIGILETGVAQDVGLDAARVDRGRRDAVALLVELDAQCLGISADAELGRVVRRLSRDADESEDTRDVDDVSLAGGPEVGEERGGAMDDPPRS